MKQLNPEDMKNAGLLVAKMAASGAEPIAVIVIGLDRKASELSAGTLWLKEANGADIREGRGRVRQGVHHRSRGEAVSRRRWFGSMLDPKAVGVGEKDIWCHPMPGDAEDQPIAKVQGFFCATDGHFESHCPGNDHGGWTDYAEMMRAFADAFEVPGCDVRLLVEPFENGAGVKRNGHF